MPEARRSASPLREVLKFGLVGLTSNLLGYVVFLLITHAGIPPRTSMTMLYVASASIAFFGNRKWTFANSGGILGPGVRYILCHLAGYTINYLMLFFLADRMGYPYQLIQASAIIVVAGFLFLAFKYFVFVEAKRTQQDRI